MSIVRCLLVLLLLTTIGCGGGDGNGDPVGEWSGTVTTEGNVTTVVNESGSVWGGNVTFVEEASIGVDLGEDPYMLGQVRALAVSDDEIYVLDEQVPAVRVYDMAGRHLRDIGAEGSGPGEFSEPDSMVIGADERVYVRDSRNARITIFSPAGEELGTIPLRGGFFTGNPMVITPNGTLYNRERISSDDPESRVYGMVPRALENDRSGDPFLPPDMGFDSAPWRLEARTENMSMSSTVPFAPGIVWELAPSGAVVTGVSNEYSFEVRYPDGKVTRVVKPGDRVSVDPAEADWQRKRVTAQMRRNVDTWIWNGEGVPAVKPAYQQFIADHSGRIWVVRPAAGSHVEGECTENPQPGLPAEPCWRATTSWEVFDDEGRFLGGVDLPEGVGSSPEPYIRGDMFLAPVTDDYGTTMVKRYRLEYPGAE